MVIGINCGHTIEGPGCGARGLIGESVHTRLVGYALAERLRKAGMEVVDCTIDKAKTQKEYLSGVTTLANSENLDWFISIHFNASPSHAGRGVEIYTYEGRQYPQALCICERLEALGFPNRGVKAGTGLYVIRNTRAKAMLIEVCFCDNQADVDLYERIGGADTVAQAISGGFLERLAACGALNKRQGREEFMESVGEIARRDWERRRIMLPSVVVAQAMKESACGTSELARNANALFGIKENGWPGRIYVKDAVEQRPDGSYITVPGTRWRAYDSFEESVIDHNDYIATRSLDGGKTLRYAPIIGCGEYVLVCQYLQSCGYATSHGYADSLVRDYIEAHGLTRFDGKCG